MEIEVLRDTSIGTVAKEAVVQLFQLYGPADREYQNRFMKIGAETNQFHVDIPLSEDERDADIERLGRIIAPAVAALAERLPKDVSFGVLELPSGCQASRQLHHGISLRAVTGWYERPIFDADGEVVSYEPPVPTLRMDVIVTTEVPTP